MEICWIRYKLGTKGKVREFRVKFVTWVHIETFKPTVLIEGGGKSQDQRERKRDIPLPSINR